MYERALELVTSYEKQQEIAKRFVALRKFRKISQQRMSQLSGVSYASIRRFEKMGEISLASFVKLALALQRYEDLDNLFVQRYECRTIEDVIRDQDN